MAEKDTVFSDDFTIKNVRLAYNACVFHPNTHNLKPGKDPKYEVTVLFPTDDKETYAALEAAAKQAANSKWGSKQPKGIHMIPIRDPNVDYSPSRTGSKMDTDAERFEGQFYIKGTSNSVQTKKDGRKVEKPRPQVFRLAGKAVECTTDDENLFHAGAYVHLKLCAHAYGEISKPEDGVGVKYLLKTVILSNKKGERLSGVMEDSEDSITSELAGMGIEMGGELEEFETDESQLSKLNAMLE